MEYISGRNNSVFKAVASKKSGSSRASIRRKLEKIKQKLRSGARLTASEKEFLRKYAPALYEEAMAMERQRQAYEERLKNCRTREEAQRIKMEKMMEIAAAEKEDPETKAMRMAQTEAAEEETAAAVRRKPKQNETEAAKKQKETQQRREETRKEAAEERLEKKRWEDRYYEAGEKPGSEAKSRPEEETGIYGPTGYGSKRKPESQPAQGEGETGAVSGKKASDPRERQTAFARGHAAYQAAAAAGKPELAAGGAAVNQGEAFQMKTDTAAETAGGTAVAFADGSDTVGSDI